MKLLHQGDHSLKLSYRRSLNFPLHIQNAVEILLLDTGRITAINNKKRISLQAGDLLVVFPNQVHGFEESLDARGYLMIIPIHPYLGVYRSILEQMTPLEPVISREQWEPAGIGMLTEMADREWQNADSNVQRSYAQLIMGKLLSMLPLTENHHIPGDALQETLIYLNAHFRENLSRDSIAKAVGYNESYLSHIFSDNLHITLKDYVTSLRVQEAAQLLHTTTMTASQVSAAVGFGSIRSFNRAFAKTMGCSPTGYRCTIKEHL